MIHTERLRIKLLSDEEAEKNKAETAAYAVMLDESKAHPELQEFYAPWEIFLNDDETTKIGYLNFKGLSEGGTARISCVMNAEYGEYTSEAVEAMREWASVHPMVKTVEEV